MSILPTTSSYNQIADICALINKQKDIEENIDKITDILVEKDISWVEPLLKNQDNFKDSLNSNYLFMVLVSKAIPNILEKICEEEEGKFQDKTIFQDLDFRELLLGELFDDTCIGDNWFFKLTGFIN